MFASAEPGTVYLVGAGPGRPDLITVRGLSLLRQADVVVHDRLVHPDLLAEAPAHAELIYVGKAPGRHSCPQETINEHLVDAGRRGGVVVRLKGGDPFVFGRGGEECLALSRAGIPFEVVPGITSAVSVPAYAGIPVTHRQVARSFTVVTGHLCDPEESDLDWNVLAGAETLVILMGLSRLPWIAETLVARGRRAETPVAVIQAGTTGDQVVARGTLADIAERIHGLEAPATIVVGDVVALGDEIAWFQPPVAAEAFPCAGPAPLRGPVPPTAFHPSALPA